MLEEFLGVCGGLGRKVLGFGVDERKREDTELRPDHVLSRRPMTSPYASPQNAAPAMLRFPDDEIRPSKQLNMPEEKRQQTEDPFGRQINMKRSKQPEYHEK